ncbi:MAG: DUF2608 domain-containing protein [Legionella sp.]|nr:DUF2608 domain-containing protein [Legionella sp.]
MKKSGFQNSLITQIYIILVGILFIGQIHATVLDFSLNTFSQIKSLYDHKLIHSDKTLIVFDIDDTLLTTTEPLGGVGWWDWQYALLTKNPTSKKLVAANFDNLLKVQNYLFSIILMRPTDAYVLPFVKSLCSHQHSLMVLTARGRYLSTSTNQQLEKNGFTDSHHHLLFHTNQPAFKEIASDKAGSFSCPHLKHPIEFSNGIMFLNGQDKGEALKCILGYTKQTYDTILFVDDSSKNTDAVRKAFNKTHGITVFNILYTHEQARENEFRHSLALQKAAYLKWKELASKMLPHLSLRSTT